MAMSIQLEQQVEETLKQAKEAFYVNSTLTTMQKNDALEVFARLIEDNANTLIAENQKDLEQAKADNLQGPMLSRLKLDMAKLNQVAQGIRDLIQLEDPAGKVLLRTKLDDGLVLEKVSVPLGVIGIIFESRPDVMPQVLSLILKSGNAVVLKGGREAAHSNRAFMALVMELNQKCPFLSPHWASLLDSREAVHSMLNYPEYVDLIIPRGSNQLVSSIMAATKIPVMGHADGICHIYVHHSAHLKNALAIIVDAKIQYPSACNAVETLLVDKEVASVLLPDLSSLATENGILLKGCEATGAILKDCQPATEADWRTEYGDLVLSIKVVEDASQAIDHINAYGSHHTDSVLASDAAVIERFLNAVDSACVFSNASTRFADGFRFGFGAEVGISTAKTHARGPVGLDGLVIYKYRLQGSGQVVSDYVGESAKPFLHQPLAI